MDYDEGPMSDAREEREKDFRVIDEIRAAFKDVADEELEREVARVVAEAKKLQAELLSRRWGKPFPSSTTILDELREERTAGMMKSGEPPPTAEELREVAEETIAEETARRMDE